MGLAFCIRLAYNIRLSSMRITHFHCISPFSMCYILSFSPRCIIETIQKQNSNSHHIIFNHCVFRSVVSYQTTMLPLYSPENVKTAGKIGLYDSIDDEVLQCYNEFALSSLIYYAMKEHACSEQSSRMTAMDGASKNAGTSTATVPRIRTCIHARNAGLYGVELWPFYSSSRL